SDLSTPTHLEHFVERPAMVEAERPAAVERTVAPPPARTGMRWLPLALAALIAFGLLWGLRGRRPNVANTASHAVNTATQGLEQLTLPGGSNISVAPGSLNYNLAKFLGDPSAQTPKTFVFDNLNFQNATTELTPESQPTVNSLASILKAYPNAHVQLV